jgi:hypothetical protein
MADLLTQKSEAQRRIIPAVFLILHTLCRQECSCNRADSEGYNRMMILRPLPSGSLRVTQGASKHMTALDSCV